jgi:U3 small nucleolar RNA-associated protein MPP10
MSTHERRLAALRTEIQALEADNVGTKEWVLLGEASARTRPHDALLGQDLDFDRATRAVPIVTDAVVAALEDRIKTRIKEGRFDDVVRGRAAGDTVPWVPSRAVDGLQDAQSAQSLAQLYEGAYVAAQSGAPAGVDDRDGRLRREHDEIARVWEGICATLDALCNAHYVPKPVCSHSSLSLSLCYVLMVEGTAESEHYHCIGRPGCIPRIGAPIKPIARQYARSRGSLGAHILLNRPCA